MSPKERETKTTEKKRARDDASMVREMREYLTKRVKEEDGGKEMKNGTLVLNVVHGKELEIEYAKTEILDKINSFFGYNCISQINLKIIEDKIKLKKSILPQIKNPSLVNKKIAGIQSPELRSSLKNLLKAFDERSK